MKCLKDFIEATNLYVNFDDCFKEFNAVLKNSLRWCEKTKWGAIQENSLTKHKVKYESISKKKHGKDMLSVPDFHESNEIFKVVSKRI